MKAIRGKKLTSKEAARVLGVSEASVKRWADSGLIPTEKTAGGHRRFRPEDVAVMRRASLADGGARAQEGGARRAPAPPAHSPRIAAGRRETLVGETFTALLAGRDEEIAALLVNLHLHGQSVGTIADNFVCAAMRKVGDLWHAGELSVAQEHVATRTAARALRGLEAAGAGEGRGARPLALSCSVEEDYHALPVRLAALTLEACGFEVFNLGVSMPFSALTEALEIFRPRLVCVSATLFANLDRGAREYAEFHKSARRGGAAVVLGGAGFADARVRRRFPADLHAESFRQLEEFAGALDAGAAA